LRPVSGRERQPSLAWRGSKRAKPGQRLCNLRNTIYRDARRRGAITSRQEAGHPRPFLGQVPSPATPRRPISAGMADISRKAFRPSTPAALATRAGCRDGGSNLALRGATPRGRTTGRTGRTMGVRTVTPGGWRRPTWRGRTLRAASFRAQPLLREMQPLKRPPEPRGASGNRAQALPSGASSSLVEATSSGSSTRFGNRGEPSHFGGNSDLSRRTMTASSCLRSGGVACASE
jgi:hypothetical protein